jgi:hypothetical protein
MAVAVTRRSLKIALIVDGEHVSKHVYDLAQWASASDTIRISHLIIQHRPQSRKTWMGRLTSRLRKGPVHIARALLWKLITRLEARDLAEIKAYEGHQATFNVGNLVPGRIHLTPIVSRSGFVHRFAAEDVETIKQRGFDLLIRCGTGILKGAILNSARLGVLSFHHADNRINRGGPPGFWEVYFRQSKTGFVIQRLTEELDGGDVLMRGHIPTQATHLRNRAMLFDKSYWHLRALLLRVAETGELPRAEPHYPYSGKLFVAPRLHELFTYTLGRACRSALGRLHRILLRRERWGISYTQADWPHAVLWRGTRIEAPAGRFLADPFVVSRDGMTCVFAEDFVYRTSKGHISVFDISQGGARELGTAVTENFHLSFPYLFEFNGTLYMCPESCAAKQIRVYECVRFPLEWKLSVISMRDVSAVDSMIFQENDLWWLLTNISTTEPAEHCAELHLFYAATPLTEHWEPHKLNPILFDPQRARNGGLLRDDRGLIRVSQTQNFQSYGASANLNRITRITREEYAEELVSSITPTFMPGIHGTHHLHSNGAYTVWDFKSWESIRQVPWFIELAAERLARAVAGGVDSYAGAIRRIAGAGLAPGRRVWRRT